MECMSILEEDRELRQSSEFCLQLWFLDETAGKDKDQGSSREQQD